MSCLMRRSLGQNFGQYKRFHCKIVHGDAINSSSFKSLGLLAQVKESRADILITDPPYCLLERRKLSGELRDEKARKRKTDHQEEAPRFPNLSSYRDFTQRWLKNSLLNGLQDSAPLVIWTNPFGKSVIIDVCKEFQYFPVGEYQWAKTTTLTQSNEINLRLYESAVIFFKTNPQSSSNSLFRVEGDIFYLKNRSLKSYEIPWSVISGYHGEKKKGETPSLPPHPFHKPLDVLKPLIATWTNSNSSVLDPFCGSGSIGRAVRALGGNRRFYGIEIMEDWVEHSKEDLQSD